MLELWPNTSTPVRKGQVELALLVERVDSFLRRGRHEGAGTHKGCLLQGRLYEPTIRRGRESAKGRVAREVDSDRVSGNEAGCATPG